MLTLDKDAFSFTKYDFKMPLIDLFIRNAWHRLGTLFDELLIFIFNLNHSQNGLSNVGEQKKLTKLDFSSAVEKDHLIMRKMSPFEFKNEKRKEKKRKRDKEKIGGSCYFIGDTDISEWLERKKEKKKSPSTYCIGRKVLVSFLSLCLSESFSRQMTGSNPSHPAASFKMERSSFFFLLFFSSPSRLSARRISTFCFNVVNSGQ